MSEDTKALVEKLETAHKRVCDLASGSRKWTMMIPVDPSDDDDLLLGRALTAAVTAVQSQAVRIGELERALAAAEAREREAYERAAKVCDKVYDEAAGWLKEHPTTHEYGEAMAYGVCEGTHDCAIAIRALAKERT